MLQKSQNRTQYLCDSFRKVGSHMLCDGLKTSHITQELYRCAAMATAPLRGGSVCDGDLLHVLLPGLRVTEGRTDDGGEGRETGQWKPYSS